VVLQCFSSTSLVFLLFFEFEPMRADETVPLVSMLIPTEWKSVDDIASFETIRAFQEKWQVEEGEDSGGELQSWIAYIGIRIRMENKRMDLLLKVVEGICWTQHLEPGEVFTPVEEEVGTMV